MEIEFISPPRPHPPRSSMRRRRMRMSPSPSLLRQIQKLPRPSQPQLSLTQWNPSDLIRGPRITSREEAEAMAGGISMAMALLSLETVAKVVLSKQQKRFKCIRSCRQPYPLVPLYPNIPHLLTKIEIVLGPLLSLHPLHILDPIYGFRTIVFVPLVPLPNSIDIGGVPE